MLLELPLRVRGCDFGIGMMSESFHIAGTIPAVSDLLKVVAKGQVQTILAYNRERYLDRWLHSIEAGEILQVNVFGASSS